MELIKCMQAGRGGTLTMVWKVQQIMILDTNEYKPLSMSSFSLSSSVKDPFVSASPGRSVFLYADNNPLSCRRSNPCSNLACFHRLGSDRHLYPQSRQRCKTCFLRLCRNKLDIVLGDRLHLSLIHI